MQLLRVFLLRCRWQNREREITIHNTKGISIRSSGFLHSLLFLKMLKLDILSKSWWLRSEDAQCFLKSRSFLKASLLKLGLQKHVQYLKITSICPFNPWQRSRSPCWQLENLWQSWEGRRKGQSPSDEHWQAESLMSYMLSSIIFKLRLSESFLCCQAESFLPMKEKTGGGPHFISQRHGCALILLLSHFQHICLSVSLLSCELAEPPSDIPERTKLPWAGERVP